VSQNQNNCSNNSRFNITAEHKDAEIEQNSGHPTSDFLLSKYDSDSLEEQEFKLRDYQRRRFSELADQEAYQDQDQIRDEFEEMRIKPRTVEPEEILSMGRKVSSHFTDRDGKLLIKISIVLLLSN